VLESGRVLGGLLFEYYRQSRCGLLAYLVVSPESRRKGIGQKLVEQSLALLTEDAQGEGGPLLAVFAEVEDPRVVPRGAGPLDPADRMRFFRSLGARWIDIPYVQPELTEGGERCRSLILLALPLSLPIKGSTVQSFLGEYYASLGVEAGDADLEAMTAALPEDVQPKDLAELAGNG
jgi:hypothetical protein